MQDEEWWDKEGESIAMGADPALVIERILEAHKERIRKEIEAVKNMIEIEAVIVRDTIDAVLDLECLKKISSI